MRNLFSSLAIDALTWIALVAIFTLVRRFISKEKPDTRFGYDLIQNCKALVRWVWAIVKKIFTVVKTFVAQRADKAAETEVEAEAATKGSAAYAAAFSRFREAFGDPTPSSKPETNVEVYDEDDEDDNF